MTRVRKTEKICAHTHHLSLDALLLLQSALQHRGASTADARRRISLGDGLRTACASGSGSGRTSGMARAGGARRAGGCERGRETLRRHESVDGRRRRRRGGGRGRQSAAHVQIQRGRWRATGGGFQSGNRQCARVGGATLDTGFDAGANIAEREAAGARRSGRIAVSRQERRTRRGGT